MLDMSSSIPIFTPSEILSWARAANAHADRSATPVAIAADLFIAISLGIAFSECQPRTFSNSPTAIGLSTDARNATKRRGYTMVNLSVKPGPTNASAIDYAKKKGLQRAYGDVLVASTRALF